MYPSMADETSTPMSIIMLAWPKGMPTARSSPKRRNSRAAMTIAEMVNALGINDVAFDVYVTLPIAACYYISRVAGGPFPARTSNVACLAPVRAKRHDPPLFPVYTNGPAHATHDRHGPGRFGRIWPPV